MISIVTKWWIVPGKEDEADAALKDLAEQVDKYEDYTLMYLIHRSVADGSKPTPPANEVVFLGTWENKADFDRHRTGPVFSAWLDTHLSLFLTNDNRLYVSAEFIHPLGGFIRAGAA